MDLSTPVSYIIRLKSSCTANTSKRIESNDTVENRLDVAFYCPYMRDAHSITCINLNQYNSMSSFSFILFIVFGALERRLVIFSPFNPRLHINQNEEKRNKGLMHIVEWMSSEHRSDKTGKEFEMLMPHAGIRDVNGSGERTSWRAINGGSKATVHE